ncbi:uncharacterized protein DUF2760 [Archangium gephyra]|uniref:Uncharacterized protein DUF2760 n=1 Tax=Archangium gephyra TaxID=48 RepID=A0AAC8Q6F3_9BACT|nr:DUF2760 domain-containing protein [Archangium gephyra]AKJ01930.1 Hypothetical protein AA314_03556 [Archangium gephyra]REG34740.1 uncharacterized protein DUF2760 [Archangium gephyra]
MTDQPSLSFFARFWLAFVCFWRIWANQAFAQAVLPLKEADAAGQLPAGTPPTELPAGQPALEKAPEKAPEKKEPVAALPPEREHAPALQFLAMLQREGRLIDFLQEDVAAFPDADVGAAARIVHEGCRKVLRQYLTLEPVLAQSEGDRVNVPAGFDAQRIRLTGNVAGQPPYTGALKHHGWMTTAVKFPSTSAAMDPRVLSPAEVELS